MKVPMSWLREYVRTDATTEQIAQPAPPQLKHETSGSIDGSVNGK